MSPLAHAMCFVDDEETHLASEQALEEIAILESLGREVQKLAFSFFDLTMGFARFSCGEMRVHRDCIDALGFELVLLIFHERDERAHYDSESGQRECGKLIDERLAASRRHHDECIATIKECVDRLPLAFAEIIMAKALTQQSTSLGLIYLDCHVRKDFCRRNYSQLLFWTFS